MKNKKGFTLLELLVAMAIIAVLLALAVYGILQVQRNSRETQRIKALQDISIAIQSYYNRFGQYPDKVDFNTELATICIATSCATQKEEVNLKNSARYTTSGKTDVNGALYHYNLLSDGYQLGYCQENGDIYNTGTSDTKYPGDSAPLDCD
jgi:prepilin-type N-terminal cleavage/methylation domain-containing protein